MIKVVWPQAQLDAWVQKAKGKTKQFATEFIQDLNEQVVMATPVKTGFLRASWYAAINAEPSAVAGGGGGVAQMNIAASELEIGDTYRAVNGAAYAARIEYGFVGVDSLGRHYNQQPRAFIRGVIDRAQEIGEAAAERVAAS